MTATVIGGLPVEVLAERSQYINMLVYGEPGVGKTVLAGSADASPLMRPVLFVDVEGGTFSLNETYPDVKVVRVKSWAEMQNLYDDLHRNEHGFRTIVIDSLTEVQKFSMINIMTNLVKVRPDVDPDIPDMRAWGKNIEQIRRFVRAYRDLPVNVIFTALAKSDKDGKTGMITKKPYLSGKLADEVAGFLDIVVYQYMKVIQEGDETQYRRLLLTAATEQLTAKDRSGLLPQVIEEPTMPTIYEHLFGNEN